MNEIETAMIEQHTLASASGSGSDYDSVSARSASSVLPNDHIRSTSISSSSSSSSTSTSSTSSSASNSGSGNNGFRRSSRLRNQSNRCDRSIYIDMSESDDDDNDNDGDNGSEELEQEQAKVKSGNQSASHDNDTHDDSSPHSNRNHRPSKRAKTTKYNSNDAVNCNNNLASKNDEQDSNFDIDSNNHSNNGDSNNSNSNNAQGAKSNIRSSSSSSTIIKFNDRKNSSTSAFCIPFDDLCGGIITIIYDYISSPRDLYNLSLQSKRLASLVTYRHVIRVAILGNGHGSGSGTSSNNSSGVTNSSSSSGAITRKEPSKTMNKMLIALQRNMIYVPSVQRLLRLINGRRCERGEACWHYNLQTQKVPQANTLDCCSYLFVCPHCSKSLNSSDGRKFPWVRSKFDELNVMRSFFHGSNSGTTQPLREAGTDSCVGPYFTLFELSQFETTYGRRTLTTLNRPPTMKEKEIDAKNRFQALQDRVERRLETDPNVEHADKIIKMIEQAQSDLKDQELRRKMEQRAAERARYDNKKSLLHAGHNTLSENLGNVEWKGLALDCEWTEYNEEFYLWRACLSYKCQITQDVMQSVISRADFATKRNLKKKATQIKAYFEVFYNSSFMEFNFFRVTDADQLRATNDKARGEEEGPDVILLKNGLRTYALNTFQEASQILTLRRANKEFFAMLKNGDLIGAFLYLLQPSKYIFQALSFAVEPIKHSLFSEEDSREYALIFWVNYCSPFYPWHGQLVPEFELAAFSDLVGLRTNWSRLNSLYTFTKERIERFLGEPETIAYLADTSVEFGMEVFHNISRAEIMKRAFFRLRMDYLLPRNEDFFSIEIHRRYYVSPEEYDLLRDED